MCPLCLSTAAWLVFGSGSIVTAGALLTGRRKRGTDDGNDDNVPSDRDA
jgi:hypothetical protein